MTDKPLAIALFTCKRFAYAERTIRSTLDRLCYSRVHVHVADDGSPDEETEQLKRIAGGYANVVAVSSTNAEGGGYGRSYNLASQVVHDVADVVLCLEDDWELMRELDPAPLISVLEGNYGLGCLRLGYLGFTQQLFGEVRLLNGAAYLQFFPTSPEPHVFAGHPRLELTSWQKYVGPWPEGLAAGATEFEVAHRAVARQGVAWPMDLVRPCGDLFAHIGSLRAGETE